MNKSIRVIFYSVLFMTTTSCSGNKAANMNSEEINSEEINSEEINNAEVIYQKREIKSTHQSIYDVKKVSGKIVKGDLFDNFDYSLYNEQGKLSETGFLDYSFGIDSFTKATTRYSYNGKGQLIRKDVTVTYHPVLKDPAQSTYRKTITDYEYGEKENEVVEIESEEMRNSSDNSVEKITDNIIRVCKYDSKDRCVEERINNITTEIRYEEDAKGNITKITRLTEGDADYIEEVRKYNENNNMTESEVFEVVTDNGDKNCVLKKVFNKQGDCILEIETDEDMGSVYNGSGSVTTMYYEYEYDKYGNWIKQISYQHHDRESTVDDVEIYASDDPKKRVLRIYEREIKYY